MYNATYILETLCIFALLGSIAYETGPDIIAPLYFKLWNRKVQS